MRKLLPKICAGLLSAAILIGCAPATLPISVTSSQPDAVPVSSDTQDKPVLSPPLGLSGTSLSRLVFDSLSAAAASGVTGTPSPSPAPDTTTPVVTEDDFRGIWVTSVLNLDYPSQTGLSVAELKKEADTILDTVAKTGYNAVIFQVRPAADALYSSKLFPWSEYLTGTQGNAPADGFDPLEYWVTQAHERGLQLHAWINPFRITQGSSASPKHDVNTLAANHPARKNPAWTVKHSDGKLYFDPGLPEVRQLVFDGVSELLQNYDIDGIQFDDYFYPDETFADDASYAKYGGAYASKDDWRRANIDAMIKGVYETVTSAKGKRSADSDPVFGISPIGIWANQSVTELGSNTQGNQSYYRQFADTRGWVKNGWLDYIAPQIYWNIGFSVADYAVLIPWWSDVVSGTDVKLYIGQAIYRSGEGKTESDAWYGTQEIVRQAALNEQYENVAGVIHFRYKFLISKPELGETVASIFSADTAVSLLTSSTPASALTMELPDISKLSVGRPSSSVTTASDTYFVLGTSNPKQPLLMDGKEVANRSADGFFGVQTTLKKGANTFTFTQEGQTSVTVTITYKPATVSSPSKMSAAEIVAGSAFPKSANEYWQPGDSVTLRCTAPIGASVKVKVGEQTYDMTPAATKAPASDGLYSTSYTYVYTFPQSSKTGELVTLGTPEYTMTLNGKSNTRKAGGALVSISPNTPYYATITAANAYAYPGSTTTGGPSNELIKGQKGRITAVTSEGTWFRLATGGWVQSTAATPKLEASLFDAGLSGLSYAVGKKTDTLTFTVDGLPTSAISYADGTLTLKVGGVQSASKLTLPQGSLISSHASSFANGEAVYSLKLADGQPLDGYYLTSSKNALTLHLKRRPVASSGDKPLTGICILLDAGHGGSDGGAAGPLGGLLSEKHINLAVAFKLKAELETRGATVMMTRTSNDTALSLAERVELSRSLRPDMFLSVHANSLAEATDATNIKGFESFYRNEMGRELSDLVFNTVKSELNLGNRASKQSNLYVNRPTWTPSALVETGFLCNVNDFSLLVSNEGQTKLAKSMANGIQAFFTP